MPVPEHHPAGAKSGSEPFTRAGTPLGYDLLSFWRWAGSDLVGNAQRGVLAEYLVARAVGAAAPVRVEWDAFDVVTPDGTKVEVKAAGYLQSWPQAKPSGIRFGIAPTVGWDAATNTYDTERRRSADVYVFAVHAHRERETLDPLDVDQWEFHVLSRRVLDEHCRGQKSIGLGSLARLGARSVSHGELAGAISAAISPDVTG